jgi:hypothetical protein
MAHCFDDTFARHVSQPRASKPALRRSSTSRSMGARSDFDASLNGGDDEDEVRSMGNSVATNNPDRELERNEQLERVKNRDLVTFENEDEYEAQLDDQ